MNLNNLKIGVKQGIGFAVVLVLMCCVVFVGTSNLNKLSGLTTKLYRHPYAVSTAILRVDANILKIHRAMKDVALAKSAAEYDLQLEKIKTFEKVIYQDIDLVMDRFLGDKKQVEDLRTMIVNWKPIRDEVVALMKDGQREAAADITKGKGAKHVGSINQAIKSFSDFAQGKADSFMVNAGKAQKKALTISYTIAAVAIMMSMAIAFLLTRSIVTPLNKAVQLAETMAQGDFTQRMDDNRGDEIGKLAQSLNHMVTSLNEMLKSILGNVETLNNSSSDLSAISQQMTQGAEQTSQKSSGVATSSEEMSSNMTSVAAASEQATQNLNMVASATEEMTATVSEIAQNSEKARSITEDAVQRSTRTHNKVNELGNSAKQIGQVTEVITDISEQVNLLALNATIEAARAGDAGKGFAVVANEIKDLAKQTADATQEIKNHIDAVQQSTSETVVEIGEITEVINNVNDMVSTIATAVEEQTATTQEIAGNITQASQGIHEVNENVVQASAVSSEISNDIAQVDQSTQEMTNGSSQVNVSAKELSGLANGLSEMVSRFKI